MLNALAVNPDIELKVLATRARVPFEQLDDFANFSIHYVDCAEEVIQYLMKHPPDLFVFTGWMYPKLTRFLATQNSNFIRVMAVDNRQKRNIRQFLGALVFRLNYANSMDYCLVPGSSATALMQQFGVEPSRIKLGYYGAFTGIYSADLSYDANKNFLYVGALSKRKNVLLLRDAFKSFRQLGGNGKLIIAGDGELRPQLEGVEGIEVLGFQQPLAVAELMKANLFQILLSREDHWATVLCEGAACGQILFASKNVGAAQDLIRHNRNGLVVHCQNADKIGLEMFRMSNWTNDRIAVARQTSVATAAHFTEKAYETSILEILD